MNEALASGARRERVASGRRIQDRIMQTDTADKPAAKRLPILPLRDVVVYPHTVIPLFVGRERSVTALDQAMAGNREILLVAQTQPDIDDPSAEGHLRDRDARDDPPAAEAAGRHGQGARRRRSTRARLRNLEVGECFTAEAEELPEGGDYDRREMDVLTRSVMSRFDQYVKLNKKIPPEILTSLSGIDSPGRLADTVAAQMTLKLSEKQKVLEIAEVRQRLEHVLGLIDAEIDMLRIEKRIRGRVKQQMEKSQREYYLNEQMKAIQKELGEMEDAPNELAELEQKIKAAGMPKEAKEKATSELNKLKLMSPMSAEATVVRNYIDWLVKVPWRKRTKVHHDLADAETRARRRSLRSREGQGAHSRVPRGAAAREGAQGADSVPRGPGRISGLPSSVLLQHRDGIGMVAGDHLDDGLLEFFSEFHVPEQDLALVTPADGFQDYVRDRQRVELRVVDGELVFSADGHGIPSVSRLLSRSPALRSCRWLPVPRPGRFGQGG